MRDNVQAGGPEDYFRKSITVPFLYCTLNEMKTRFTNLPPPEPLWFHLLSIIENIAPLSEPPPPPPPPVKRVSGSAPDKYADLCNMFIIVYLFSCLGHYISEDMLYIWLSIKYFDYRF